MLYTIATAYAVIFVVCLAMGLIPLAARALAIIIPIGIALFFLVSIAQDYRAHVAYKTACPSCPD